VFHGDFLRWREESTARRASADEAAGMMPGTAPAPRCAAAEAKEAIEVRMSS
jgi:hypothetical protein